MAKNWSDQF